MMKLIDGKMESLKKGSWSPEEDEKLSSYIKRYGIWNWSLMPKAAGLSRSGKSCRLRWMNYLSPSIKREGYSLEEIKTIIMLHKTLGNKWSKIAENLPGRTDNGIKNFWHGYLEKRCSSIAIGPPDLKNSHGNEAKRVKRYKHERAGRNHSSRTELDSPTRDSTLEEKNELKSSASESTLQETYELKSSASESTLSSLEEGSLDSKEMIQSECEMHLQFQGDLLLEPLFLVEDNALNTNSSSFGFVEHVEWGFQEYQSMNVQEYACDSFNDDLNSWLNNVFVEAEEVEYTLW